MRRLSMLLAISGAVAAGCAMLHSDEAVRYELIAKYQVGGEGGWDFIKLDDHRHRLFISRGNRVQVVDSRTGGAAGEISGTEGVHGIALAEGVGLGFTSNGRSDSVTVFDLETLAVRDSVKVTGTNPDAIIYEPVADRVMAFNGRSANVSMINPRTRLVTDTIPLPGKPEVAVSDGQGRVYVNIEDRNSIAVLDIKGHRLATEWMLNGCEAPTGLAIDVRRHRLFSACHNKKLMVVDSESGQVLQELPIGAEVDGTEFDPATGLVFTSNGDGTLTVIHAETGRPYRVLQDATTQSRARTLALDRDSHAVYLVTASFEAAPAATPADPRPRARMIPGSFVVLVMGPTKRST